MFLVMYFMSRFVNALHVNVLASLVRALLSHGMSSLM